jgi:two-component system chemotaxis response regulator CheB
MYGAVHKQETSDLSDSLRAWERPYAAFDVVLVAASAGSLRPLQMFLAGLPFGFPAPVIVVYHMPPRHIYLSCLDRLLQRVTALPVKWAEDGEIPRPGRVYIAPQDKFTVLDPDGSFFTSEATPLAGRAKPLADPIFRSAAEVYGPRTLAVVLSGMLSDGAEGASAIAAAGGRVLAQSFRTALYADMPRAAMQRARIGLAFDAAALSHAVVSLVMAPGAAQWFRVEPQPIHTT